MIEVKNAIITGTSIDMERGWLTAWLYLDYGGSGQGFGGICLYNPCNTKDDTFQWAGNFLFGCMRAVGVEKWDQLKGKAVRVRADRCRVYAIGHIIEDKWFTPGPKTQKEEDD